MKNIVLLFMLAALAGSVFTQSGRRAAIKPTPVATPAADDPSEYSESRPRPQRIRAARPVDLNNGSATGTAPVPPTADNTGVDETDVLKVETNLVTIPVSVFDRYGLYIPGLRQNDFKVFDNGVEQDIAYFGTSDKPFTVALVIDVSPSTAYKIDEIHAAAMAFVDQLEPQDSVLVIAFDHSVDVLTEPTKDRDKIYKAIKKSNFGDGTSLYNAVDEALRKQLGRIEGRKAVVLFTDGVDTTSRKNTYDGTVAYAEESDSLVFPIYFNTYFDNQRRVMNGSTFPPIFGGGGMSQNGTSAAAYATGRQYLEDLADATGGRVFRPEATPGGLTRAFEGIAEELRRQYNIGFIPKEEGKQGQRRQLKIRVNRPNLVIRSRDSYIVGAAAQPTAPAPVQKPKT